VCRVLRYAALVNLGLKAEERQELIDNTAATLLLGQLRFVDKSGFEGGSMVEPADDVQCVSRRTRGQTLIRSGRVNFTRALFCMRARALNIAVTCAARWGRPPDHPRYALEHVCRILGLTTEQLSRALTVRELVIRGEAQLIQQTSEQALDAKDALAKAVYSANFDWVVARVNKATAASSNWNKVRRAVVNLAKAIKSGAIDQDSFFAGDFARSSSGGVRFSTFGKGPSAKPVKGTKSGGLWDGFRSIGILDIFGFEIFETNSFEQLCINYANERLQQLFNLSTFRREEEAYTAEGVPFEPILFADNADVLELIDRKPNGILPVLDEEVVLPRTTDETFLRKLGEKHEKKHARYVRPKGNASRTGFGIAHYAGSVTYEVKGFLQKNKDELSPDVLTMMRGSSNGHVAEIFMTDEEKAEKKGSSTKASAPESRFKRSDEPKALGRPVSMGRMVGGAAGAAKVVKTQGALFRRQVDDLMGALEKTRTSFIRCIKPNGEKRPGLFCGNLSYEQLQCSGVFEAVTIRRQGYPARLSHASFFRRYRGLASLSPDAAPLAALAYDTARTGVPLDAKVACATLIGVLAKIPRLARMSVDCQMGNTMVLWRTEVNKAITLVRADVEKKAAATLQALGRGLLACKLVEVLFTLRADLRRAVGYNGDSDAEVNEVERLLKESNDAPFKLREHHQLEDKFKIILKRRKVAASIDEMAARSIEQVDDDFVSVCIAARELDFTGAAVTKIFALYEQFTERQSALNGLRQAIEATQVNLPALEAALAEAQALKAKFGDAFCKAEEEQATRVVKQVKAEERALTLLAQVLENDSLSENDPRVHGKATPELNAEWLKGVEASIAQGPLPASARAASGLMDDPGSRLDGFPDLRLRSVMQWLADSGSLVKESGDVICRTARGKQLLPLGAFALRLRASYVTTRKNARETKNNKKRSVFPACLCG